MDMGRARQLVNQIIKDKDFSLEVENYEKFKKAFYEEYFITCGVTKIVVVSEDFVIKFGFENEKWALEKESKVYRDATAAGLGEFFAETSEVQVTNGINWIAQERCDTDEEAYFDLLSDYWYDEIWDWDSKDEWERRDDLENLDDSEIVDGIFRETAVIDFIKENEIHDFHCGNFGFRGAQPVLIDFCGC